jgi:amidase
VRAAGGNARIHELPELAALDAVALSRAIRARRVSCTEVMTTFLDHIERVNPAVNAIVSLRPRDVLLALAGARDAELARGQVRGVLHGFPHAVKDLAATKGLRTTWGSPLLDSVPEQDDLFVRRLRESGAIFIGKTNASEFGLGSQTYNAVFGATGNAYDPSKTAGGSSGGAAAAVALRMLPVADGSDMMGSLRNPAAFNNVIGFRPSCGRGPDRVGELILDPLSVDGPMARSAADAALLLSVMAGPEAGFAPSLEQDPARVAEALARDFAGTRIAWLGNLDGALPMQADVLALCEASFAALAAIGCRVEPAQPDFPPEKLWRTWLTLRHWLVATELAPLYRAAGTRDRLKPEALWEIEGGLALGARDVCAASAARADWCRALEALFEHYDYLLLPSAQVFPFDKEVHWPRSIEGVAMDTYHRWMQVVVPGTLSGGPVISVPVGFNEAGLPMGMQIIGRNHADLTVLQLAHAYEQAAPWVRAVPPAMLAAS